MNTPQRGGMKTVTLRSSRSLEEARDIFDQVYMLDQKNDDPEQFRAIGWRRGRLYSVIFEIKHDSKGEYYHLITAWKATTMEQQAYAENV